MRIHFVSASSETGQFALLAENVCLNSLLSYEHKRREKYFAVYWEKLVQIHWSRFANLREPDTASDTVADVRPRVIIDSGAFTAFTTGKIIKPQAYAEWALDFKTRWEAKMRSLCFMNLDVIGDQEETWKNQEILENLGMQPIPIVTRGAAKNHLDRAIANYHYIALGGLVPVAAQPKQLRAWLDWCFAIIVAHFKKTGVMPKVHLLGITSDWTIKRYPCFSSDSSAWISCLRFGRGGAAGIKKIPRYRESDAAMAATLHVLRSEIRQFKRMEEEATNLWRSRGVIFDE